MIKVNSGGKFVGFGSYYSYKDTPTRITLLQNASWLPATSLLEMTEPAVMSLHYWFKALTGFEWSRRGRADNDGFITAGLLLGPTVLSFFTFHCQSSTWAASDISDNTKSLQPSSASSVPPHSYPENTGACVGHSLHCCGCFSPWLSLLDFKE